MSEFQEKYLPFFKQHMVPLGLGILGLICLAYGLIVFLMRDKEPKEITFHASQAQNAAAKPTAKHISIDIEGAVIKPGVYDLASDSRLQDALIAAGGMREDADRLEVARSMNLASKLTDGAKIYIPFVGEERPVESSGGVLGTQASGSMNINTASASQLEDLPGIGKVTAEKIISGRPYSSIKDLTQKKIVSTKVFDQIKERIRVN